MCEHRCPDCGDPLYIDREPYRASAWTAYCVNCSDYDVPIGYGKTPDAAAQDYIDSRE